jgi:hypothetical protein
VSVYAVVASQTRVTRSGAASRPTRRKLGNAGCPTLSEERVSARSLSISDSDGQDNILLVKRISPYPDHKLRLITRGYIDMPFIALQTNVEVKDRQALVAALSSAAGASVGKPEAVVSAQVAYNPDMMFAGTNAPNAIISMVRV